MEQPLLEVKDLAAHFTLGRTAIRAVDGVSFSIRPGEVVGLVGESGCGKTVTTQCILGLLPPPGRIVAGDITLRGASLLSLRNEEMRQIRGGRIAIVVQDALAALNPMIPVGEQVADVLMSHRPLGRKAAWERAVELLREVGIPDAQRRARGYAHELSGGMQQRVIIAAALACGPELIIADEPTTALDVTIQQQILSLLARARQETGAAILYISHDLAVIARLCDRVLIMYAGRIIEEAPASDLFRDPQHPYTQGLLASIPPLGGDPIEFLPAIKGLPPDPSRPIQGCRFAPRCPYVHDACLPSEPRLVATTPGRQVRCVLYEGGRRDTLPAIAELSEASAQDRLDVDRADH